MPASKENMPMPAATNVLIVGGGISGMTLAIALRRAGIGCELVEITRDWTVPGVGIALQGAALRALRSVGLLDECVRRGFGYSHFIACDAQGNVTGRIDMPLLNGPDYPATIGIMRQELHNLLKEAMAQTGVPARPGTTISALEQHDDHVIATFTDGTRGSYGLVVGADGAFSKVRELTFGPDVAPQYTGQAVWRITVARPKEVRARHSFFGKLNKSGFNPVSQTQMYIYIVQNLPEFARLTDDELPKVMHQQLAEFGGLLGAARDSVKDVGDIVYRPIHSHIMPPPWYRGRVVLIGDAAHTTTPHLASGAGIAVEDSVVLAEELAANDDLSAALAHFMERRYERCRLIVENSHTLGEWEKDPSTPGADPIGLMNQSYRALAEPI
jgi:2-polyprenyl-6-methoxyphenol hydroxylase-like FAD-dependent oxidoreductase